MKFPQARQPSDTIRDRGQPIVGHPQLNQAFHMGNDLGDRFKRILAEVQVAKLCQSLQRLRQRGQLIVMQIKKVGKAAEIAQRVRHVGKLVVTEIKHAQLLQAADAVGEVRQPILGQNQGFEFSSLPDPCRDDTEPFVPEREIWSRRVLHQVTLASFASLAKGGFGSTVS